MSPAARTLTESVDHYREAHARFAAQRSGDPEWLAALRAQALEAFAEVGFPSTRQEDWRYTNLAPLAKLRLVPAEGGAANAEDEGLREALANAVADAKEQSFPLLNAAFLDAVSWVQVPANTRPEEPVRVRVAAPSAGEMRNARVQVVVETGAEATVVVETEATAAQALVNLVVEAEVGANASLDLVLVQPGGDADASFQISSTSARVGRDGRFSSHTLTAGGLLVRNDLDVVLAEEGASCDLRGLFLGTAARVVDNHSSVDHAVPHCSSHELYKGILAGRSKGVFRGRVIVRPDAQKTDAVQSNPNLLLGTGAEIDTKPQLEIYADDVKCSHGATVGQLDEDAIFYLRSRGIGAREARELMVRAFANEILEAVPAPGATSGIGDALSRALEGGE